MSRMNKAVCLSVALVGFAGAQTKISGTADCAKPDVSNIVQVGDSKTHVLLLTQQKCTWTKALDMEGAQSKDEIDSVTSDVHGANSRDQGYGVGSMSNGDKYYVRFTGTSKLKDNVPESFDGKWNFTGGTGKLKGVKGGGTYKCTGKPDSTSNCDIEGEYSLSSPSKK